MGHVRILVCNCSSSSLSIPQMLLFFLFFFSGILSIKVWCKMEIKLGLFFGLPFFFFPSCLAFAYCFSHVCNLAVYFRKYWFVFLGLDQRRMSGLMFASMSGRALYHVNHQNVLQFFLEISYSVFRWEFMPVPVRNVFNLVKRGVILISFLKLLCSML